MKTTIIIPHGQPEKAQALAELLTHCVKTGISPHCRVIVADGTPNGAGVPDGIERMELPGLGLTDRVAAALETVSTPLAMVLGDDDLIHTDGLRACETALCDQSNEDCALAMGDIVGFGQGWSAPWYVQPYGKFMPGAPASERVPNYLAKYTAPLFYALGRTWAQKRIYNAMKLLQGQFASAFEFGGHVDAMCHEFAQTGTGLACGTLIRVPGLMASRRYTGSKQLPYSYLIGQGWEAYVPRVKALAKLLARECGAYEETLGVAIWTFMRNAAADEQARARTHFAGHAENPQFAPQSLFKKKL